MKRYNHYDQPGTDKAQAVEEDDGKYVLFEDVETLLDRICEATSDPSIHALAREALKP